MNEAASEARKATSAATSSGVPAEGVLAREEQLGLLVEVRVDERRDDEAGADRVDPDAACSVLERGVLGQADDRVLGRHVGGGAGEADRAEDGGDVDDRASPAQRR